MKLDGEQASRIAHEIYELVGHVIIGHEDGGNGKNRKWRLGKPLLKLWGIPVGETWTIIGFATTADYLGQIEIIKSLRPDWPTNYANPGGAAYYTLALDEAA